MYCFECGGWQVKTNMAMWQFGKGYGKWGLMVGSVFEMILSDVEREGWSQVSFKVLGLGRLIGYMH